MRYLHHLFALSLLLTVAIPAHAEKPLVMHFPDGGAPPWLYLSPGAKEPSGLIADLIALVARRTGRELRYAYQPRETGSASLLSGSADGAMFFGVTRPADKDVLLSEPVLKMDTLLVTLRGKALNFSRPLDLKDRRICTLTDEVYPPLTLLAMNGTLLQRKAKTEQAQLMMLRNEDCVAAVVNGPMYRWLASRYHWDDLRTEPQRLLTDNLRVGFAPGESALVEALNETLRRLKASGELNERLARHLPGTPFVAME